MINLTNDLPFGIVSPSLPYQPMAQWKAMKSYIHQYILSNPQLPPNLQVTLLNFNAQYLLKIAEQKPEITQLKEIPLSPLKNDNLAYHRVAYRRYKLIEGHFSSLKKYQPNHFITNISNDSYRYLYDNISAMIFIKPHYTSENVKNKALYKLKQLNDYFLNCDNENNKKNIKINFNVLVENDTDYIQAVSRSRLIFKEVKLCVENYPFTKPAYKDLAAKIIDLAFIHLYSGNRVLVASHYFKIPMFWGGGGPSLQTAAAIYVQSNCFKFSLFSHEMNKFPVNVINTHIPAIPTILGNHINRLKEFIEARNESNEIRILGGALVHLFEGLYGLKLESFFQAENMQNFLWESTRRIKHYLNIIMNDGELNNFGKYFDLLTEELILILSISKPYTGNALDLAIQEKMIGFWPKPTLIRVNHGGMQCFYEIFHSLRKLRKHTGKPAEMLFFNDIYFEISSYLKFAGSEHVGMFSQTKTYKVSGQDPESMNNCINLLKSQNVKIDALFIDIHQSAKNKLNVQEPYDVISVLKALIDKEVVGDSFVCVLDNTIGSWGSDEINAILDFYRQDIREGKLHFVIYRSLHKFDIFGTDKFNGGCYLVYSKENTEFSKLIAQNKSTMLPFSIDWQAYTHFYTHAHRWIKAYYEQIVENTEFLFNCLDKSFIGKFDNTRAWVVEKRDTKTTYLGIIVPFDYDLDWGSQEKNSMINYRESFGYRETSISNLKSYNKKFLRITPGLESKNALREYAQLLTTVIRNSMNMENNL